MDAEIVRGYTLSLSVDQDGLSQRLQTLLEGDTTYGIVRRVEAIAWFKGSQDGLTLYPLGARSEEPTTLRAMLDDWREGQAFNLRAELRWWQKDRNYDLLVLTEEEDSPFFGEAAGDNWGIVEAGGQGNTLLLEGSVRDQGDARIWSETRLPRALFYPEFSTVAPRSVRYYKYRASDGAVQFLRWVEVV